MASTISVIIPVYNVEPYIRQCLDSIINQTYRNLEIIIVDDGSPDNCGIICDEYAEKDERIMVFHKQNGGVNSARNLGIQNATGEWIAFVDSDDWCDLDYYEKFMDCIGNKCPDVFQACGFIFEYPNSKSQFKYNFREDYQETDRVHIEKFMMDITGIGMPWDKLYRREFIIENHLLFDTSCKAFDDHLFNLQVYDHAKNIAGSVFAGYHYRQIAISITKGFNPKKNEQNYEAISKIQNYIRQQNMPDELKTVAHTDAIVAIVISMNCYYFHSKNDKSYREVANEIKAIKKLPYYQEAIWSVNDNRYLTFKQRVFKYMLRLPCIWPIKVLHSLNK